MNGPAQARGRLILGGSFNPPHVGHLRLAVEAAELLRARVDRVELVPCARPPHKNSGNLLPFALRAAMLDASLAELAERSRQASAAPLPPMRCNRLEAGLPGISYTWDTLAAMRENAPDEARYFLLGSRDYALLPQWHRGLELPVVSHLVVAPRDAWPVEDFVAATRALWPEARPTPVSAAEEAAGMAAMRTPLGGLCLYAPVPWLDVSASRIRRLWLDGRHVDYLVPAPVSRMLQTRRQDVRARWQENR